MLERVILLKSHLNKNYQICINVYNIIPNYLTAPTGPFHGMLLKLKAADAALIACTSGRFIESTDNILHTICVSFRKFCENNGRSERSISRLQRISFSDGPANCDYRY